MHHEMNGKKDALRCADCGRTGDASTIEVHSGAVSRPGDEGRVRHTAVALCPACAAERLEVQESALL